MRPRRSQHAFVASGERDSIREAEAEKDGEAMVESISGLPMFPEALHRTLACLDTDKPKETKKLL